MKNGMQNEGKEGRGMRIRGEGGYHNIRNGLVDLTLNVLHAEHYGAKVHVNVFALPLNSPREKKN